MTQLANQLIYKVKSLLLANMHACECRNEPKVWTKLYKLATQLVSQLCCFRIAIQLLLLVSLLFVAVINPQLLLFKFEIFALNTTQYKCIWLYILYNSKHLSDYIHQRPFRRQGLLIIKTAINRVEFIVSQCILFYWFKLEIFWENFLINRVNIETETQEIMQHHLFIKLLSQISIIYNYSIKFCLSL